MNKKSKVALLSVIALIGLTWIAVTFFTTSPMLGSVASSPDKMTNLWFEKHRSRETIEKAIRKQFPVGSTKAQIDKRFLHTMKLEESKPWHRERRTMVFSKGKNDYNIYYFQKDEKGSPPVTGRYVHAVYDLDDTLIKPLRYGTVTLVKGHGIEVLFSLK